MCLDLLDGCLVLSVACLDLSFGCLDLSFGCLDLSFGCLDLSFGCLDLLGAPIWLTLPSRSESSGVRESVNKSAASAASLDYVKFQAVIKSAASAASLRGGRATGRLDHGLFVIISAALAAKKKRISDSVCAAEQNQVL